jgi:hypothetical protein
MWGKVDNAPCSADAGGYAFRGIKQRSIKNGASFENKEEALEQPEREHHA